LLAETGLFGFILYFSFLFSVLGDALMGLQGNKPFLRYLGIAGLFSLIAIALYNNTQDSFATPNIWLIPGVVAGIVSNNSFIADPKNELGSEQENR
jgi:hypothetical protein